MGRPILTEFRDDKHRQNVERQRARAAARKRGDLPTRPPSYAKYEGTFTPVELDQHEQSILYLLCKEGRYHSSVLLAADLFETTYEVQTWRVLEWNLVELLLADMNEKGLVTYRLGKFRFGEGISEGQSDVLIHIRPTMKGYKVAKVEFKWQHEVGAGVSKYDQPLHGRNDKTDFRNHGEVAVGLGPITHEDLIEHCVECDHINKHRAQLRELYGTDEV